MVGVLRLVVRKGVKKKVWKGFSRSHLDVGADQCQYEVSIMALFHLHGTSLTRERYPFPVLVRKVTCLGRNICRPGCSFHARPLVGSVFSVREQRSGNTRVY